MGKQAAPMLRVHSVENGVIVSTDNPVLRNVVMEQTDVFTDPSAFADYMRAWFVAHHGHVPTTQLPVGKPESPPS